MTTPSQNSKLYTIGYTDLSTNYFITSKNIYTDIVSAAYDMNYTIQTTILKKFDVLLPHKFTYVPNNEKVSVSNELKLEYSKSLLINKNEYVIDIYLKKEKKGYIYNSNDNLHIFKFFINEHQQGEPKEKAFNNDTEDQNIQFDNVELEPEVLEVVLNNNHENLIKELREKIKKFKKD